MPNISTIDAYAVRETAEVDLAVLSNDKRKRCGHVHTNGRHVSGFRDACCVVIRGEIVVVITPMKEGEEMFIVLVHARVAQAVGHVGVVQALRRGRAIRVGPRKAQRAGTLPLATVSLANPYCTGEVEVKNKSTIMSITIRTSTKTEYKQKRRWSHIRIHAS